MAAPKRWAATVAGTPEKLGITLVRVIIGVVFLIHGYQKWFIFGPSGTVGAFSHMNIPAYATYAAMTAELVCGGLLVVGFLTRLAAIPIIVVMTVAILKVHLAHGFYLTQGSLGYEYALTLGLAALGLVFTGPGMLAADNLLA